MTQSPDTGEDGKAAPLAIWSALATVYVGTKPGARKKFQAVLAKVPNREPEAVHRLPNKRRVSSTRPALVAKMAEISK